MSGSAKLIRQIEIELAQLEGLTERHPQLLVKGPHELPTPLEIDALAALLHSFYTGVENLFKRISVTLDGGLPEGESWHVQLLDSMMHPTDLRGPVITEELRTSLRRFLGFRHMFRHAYSFELQWSKMAPLVNQCRATFAQLRAEVRLFLGELK